MIKQKKYTTIKWHEQKDEQNHVINLQQYVLLYYIISLTHWGRVTHICVNKLTIIGSDNGLSPGRR